MTDLNLVFQPSSVAVVGASNKPGSVGNSLINNLIRGFAGRIYPVNPKDESVAGLKAYLSLSAISAPIDLMIIAVPAAIVPSVLEEGGRLGIKGAVVISAGFKEAGREDLEKQLQEICQRYDITLIGPNCLGVINPALSLNASFTAMDPEPGKVAFVSQSGAICTAVIDCAQAMGIGFSKFISVGNKAVIDELAILDYLAADQETEIIALYAEQLSQPEKLMAQVRSLSYQKSHKPVIILKSGRSTAGASASASHTGALAGNDAAYAALFRQAGIIRAEKMEELFDYLKIFSNNPLAPASSLAIITNAGGPGVVAIDAAVAEDLSIAQLSPETEAALTAVLPVAANVHNPIDVLGDAKADRYRDALEAVLADNKVDSVLLILTPQAMTETEATAQAIIAAKKKYQKPLAVAFMGEHLVAAGLQLLSANGVAAYSFPEAAIKSLRVLNDFYNNQAALSVWQAAPRLTEVDREKVASIFTEAKVRGQVSFPEASALAVLEAYHFPILTSRLARTREEAIAIAKEIDKKLVLKIVSPDILHKSDAGGIMLNVDPAEAGEKFTELMARVAEKKPAAKLDGVLLVEMITEPGIELILGSVKDPSLGNTIMLGLGGIYVEIFKDVVFGLNPLNHDDVAAMLAGLKSKSLLAGARGAVPVDQEAIIACVLRLAQLLADFPEIKELDINPLLALPAGQGTKVLDARIIID